MFSFKKPPRGNVEALKTDTLRESETVQRHYDIKLAGEQVDSLIT